MAFSQNFVKKHVRTDIVPAKTLMLYKMLAFTGRSLNRLLQFNDLNVYFSILTEFNEKVDAKYNRRKSAA